MSERRPVRCAGHGEAWETYVCEHLVKKAKQPWFSAYPDEENPWPDAWCGKCDAAFQREGEWNERNEGEMRIKLLCSGCYIEGRMDSVESLKGAKKRGWDDYVARACVEQDARQKKMIAELRLEDYPRWDVDMALASLRFSGGDLEALDLEIEAIGSFSARSDTWLWAWCNWHLPQIVRKRIRKVGDAGEKEGFLHLTEPKWRATEHDGWHMSAIAARELRALGIYRIPGDEVASFVAIMGPRAAR